MCICISIGNIGCQIDIAKLAMDVKKRSLCTGDAIIVECVDKCFAILARTIILMVRD